MSDFTASLPIIFILTVYLEFTDHIPFKCNVFNINRKPTNILKASEILQSTDSIFKLHSYFLVSFYFLIQKVDIKFKLRITVVSETTVVCFKAELTESHVEF